MFVDPAILEAERNEYRLHRAGVRHDAARLVRRLLWPVAVIAVGLFVARLCG